MQQEFAPDGEDPPEQLAGEVAGQLASRRSSDVPPSETVRRASAGAATSAMRTAWASIGCEELGKVEQSEEEINPDQLYPARVGPSVRTRSEYCWDRLTQERKPKKNAPNWQ